MATAKKTYAEQLKDPRWQKKRLEILARDEWTCQLCRDKETTLHVHHKHYYKGRLPWDYDEADLVTLCENCHEGIDAIEDTRKKVFARLAVDGPWSVPEAIALVAGWADQSCGYDLGEFRSESPYNFKLGELASLIDVFTPDYELLGELLDALRALNFGQRRAAVEEFTRRLQEAKVK